jgi:hypothetical protein
MRTVRQQRDILQPSPDTMSSIDGTPIDCPTRNAVTVVNLFQRDASRHHNVFHLGSMFNSSVSVGVERLNQHAATPIRQSGPYESSRIIGAQQSSLNTHASAEE